MLHKPTTHSLTLVSSITLLHAKPWHLSGELQHHARRSSLGIQETELSFERRYLDAKSQSITAMDVGKCFSMEDLPCQTSGKEEELTIAIPEGAEASSDDYHRNTEYCG